MSTSKPKSPYARKNDTSMPTMQRSASAHQLTEKSNYVNYIEGLSKSKPKDSIRKTAPIFQTPFDSKHEMEYRLDSHDQQNKISANQATSKLDIKKPPKSNPLMKVFNKKQVSNTNTQDHTDTKTNRSPFPAYTATKPDQVDEIPQPEQVLFPRVDRPNKNIQIKYRSRSWNCPQRLNDGNTHPTFEPPIYVLYDDEIEMYMDKLGIKDQSIPILKIQSMDMPKAVVANIDNGFSYRTLPNINQVPDENCDSSMVGKETTDNTTMRQSQITIRSSHKFPDDRLLSVNQGSPGKDHYRETTTIYEERTNPIQMTYGGFAKIERPESPEKKTDPLFYSESPLNSPHKIHSINQSHYPNQSPIVISSNKSRSNSQNIRQDLPQMQTSLQNPYRATQTKHPLVQTSQTQPITLLPTSPPAPAAQTLTPTLLSPLLPQSQPQTIHQPISQRQPQSHTQLLSYRQSDPQPLQQAIHQPQPQAIHQPQPLAIHQPQPLAIHQPQPQACCDSRHELAAMKHRLDVSNRDRLEMDSMLHVAQGRLVMCDKELHRLENENSGQKVCIEQMKREIQGLRMAQQQTYVVKGDQASSDRVRVLEAQLGSERARVARLETDLTNQEYLKQENDKLRSELSSTTAQVISSPKNNIQNPQYDSMLDTAYKDLLTMSAMVKTMVESLNRYNTAGDMQAKIINKLKVIDSRLNDIKSLEDLKKERKGLEHIIEALRSKLEASRRDYKDSVTDRSQRSSITQKTVHNMKQSNPASLMASKLNENFKKETEDLKDIVKANALMFGSMHSQNMAGDIKKQQNTDDTTKFAIQKDDNKTVVMGNEAERNPYFSEQDQSYLVDEKTEVKDIQDQVKEIEMLNDVKRLMEQVARLKSENKQLAENNALLSHNHSQRSIDMEAQRMLFKQTLDKDESSENEEAVSPEFRAVSPKINFNGFIKPQAVQGKLMQCANEGTNHAYKSIDFVGDRPSLIKTNFNFININDQKPNQTQSERETQNLQLQLAEDSDRKDEENRLIPSEDMVYALANYISNMHPADSVEDHIEAPVAARQPRIMRSVNPNLIKPKPLEDTPEKRKPRVQGSINPNLVKNQAPDRPQPSDRSDKMPCSGIFGIVCETRPDHEPQSDSRGDGNYNLLKRQSDEHRHLIRALYAKEEIVDGLKIEADSVQQRLKEAQEHRLMTEKKDTAYDKEHEKIAKQVIEDEIEVERLKQKLAKLVLRESQDSMDDQSEDNSDIATPKTVHLYKPAGADHEDNQQKTRNKPNRIQRNQTFEINDGSYRSAPEELNDSYFTATSGRDYNTLSIEELKMKLAKLRQQKQEMARRFKDLVQVSKNEREQLLNKLEKISNLSSTFCMKLGKTVNDPK